MESLRDIDERVVESPQRSKHRKDAEARRDKSEEGNESAKQADDLDRWKRCDVEQFENSDPAWTFDERQELVVKEISFDRLNYRRQNSINRAEQTWRDDMKIEGDNNKVFYRFPGSS